MQKETEFSISSNPEPNWHVLGPGAIGSLFSWHLKSAGFEPTLIYRHPQEGSVTVEMQADPHGSAPQSRPFRVDDGISPISHLLVTVKAHQTEQALQTILPRLNEETIIVLLQNGMGAWESIRRLLPASPYLIATTTEGAYRVDRNKIIHAGKGMTWIGALEPAYLVYAETLSNQWQSLGLDVQYDPNVLERLWHKLAINCAINPLTVIYDCKNGELLERPQALQTMEKLCEEVEQVMAKALNQPIATSKSGQLFELVCAVARKTANNISSMLQDVRAGRDTEIHFITGYLVQEANRLSIKVPHNSQILTRLSKP